MSDYELEETLYQKQREVYVDPWVVVAKAAGV